MRIKCAEQNRPNKNKKTSSGVGAIISSCHPVKLVANKCIRVAAVSSRPRPPANVNSVTEQITRPHAREMQYTVEEASDSHFVRVRALVGVHVYRPALRCAALEIFLTEEIRASLHMTSMRREALEGVEEKARDVKRRGAAHDTLGILWALP